ncbi:MAG: T9SS C-terminal target domain-containing protein, partial [Mariniphaga sp.]|nr:T9SS C-terminal target domain-containing protein [Mariniphaga sp.]
YEIKDASKIELSVFDKIGRLQSTIVSEYKIPGMYSVQFDASQLPDGSYYYLLKSRNEKSVKKMTLIK